MRGECEDACEGEAGNWTPRKDKVLWQRHPRPAYYVVVGGDGDGDKGQDFLRRRESKSTTELWDLGLAGLLGWREVGCCLPGGRGLGWHATLGGTVTERDHGDNARSTWSGSNPPPATHSRRPRLGLGRWSCMATWQHGNMATWLLRKLHAAFMLLCAGHA